MGSVGGNNGIGSVRRHPGMRSSPRNDHRAAEHRAAADHAFACHHHFRLVRLHHPAILHADAYASPWLGSTVPTSLLVMRPFASFQIWRR